MPPVLALGAAGKMLVMLGVKVKVKIRARGFRVRVNVRVRIQVGGFRAAAGCSFVLPRQQQ